MSKRYVCDMCGLEAEGEGQNKSPKDWMVANITLSRSSRVTASKHNFDVCPPCATEKLKYDEAAHYQQEPNVMQAFIEWLGEEVAESARDQI